MAIDFNPTIGFLSDSWGKEFANTCNTFHSTCFTLPSPHDPLHFRSNPDSLCYAPSLVSSSIASADSLIAQYEEISSQLHLLQSNVQKRIQSLQQWTDNRKSIIAPIRRLSPDLIDLIMEHATTTSFEEHRTYDPAVCFSHVCSTWRSHTLNRPFLWSKFIIYLFPIPQDQDHVLERIDVFLSRSYPVPLHIIIEDVKPSLSSTGRTEQDILDMDLINVVSPIREAILGDEVSERLRYLDMTSVLLSADTFPKINFPLLQTLTVSGHPRSRVSARFQTRDHLTPILLASPQLRNLNLKLRFVPTARHSLPCDNLEWLKLSPHCFVWKIHFLSLSNLRTLYLVGDADTGIAETFPALLNLPSLNVLYTEGPELLERLETPQLTEFIMWEDTRAPARGDHRHSMHMDHSIQKFLLSSGCSNRLTHLTLILFPSDIPDVINLLELVSELEFLDLNGRVADVVVDEDDSGLDDSNSKLDHTISKHSIADYLYAFAELFNVMTYIFPDPNLDIATSSSPQPPITILPKLKYLTFKSPNLLPPQFLTMVQSRSVSHPPHAKLLRLELWIAREPTKTALSPEEVASLRDDWDGIRDTLLELKKDGKMDVHMYSSNSAWL